MNKTSPTWSEVEARFDEKFPSHDLPTVRAAIDNIKLFYESELTLAFHAGEQAMEERVRAMVKEWQEANVENNMLSVSERFAVNDFCSDLLSRIEERVKK